MEKVVSVPRATRTYALNIMIGVLGDCTGVMPETINNLSKDGNQVTRLNYFLLDRESAVLVKIVSMHKLRYERHC